MEGLLSTGPTPFSFHFIGPLGPLVEEHIPIPLHVPAQNTKFLLSWRLLVEGLIPNIGENKKERKGCNRFFLQKSKKYFFWIGASICHYGQNRIQPL